MIMIQLWSISLVSSELLIIIIVTRKTILYDYEYDSPDASGLVVFGFNLRSEISVFWLTGGMFVFLFFVFSIPASATVTYINYYST